VIGCYTILYISARCAGATYVSLAFALLTHTEILLASDLETRFWNSDDEAYTSTESTINPWPGAELEDEAKETASCFSF
jgi:hypothetical protein